MKACIFGMLLLIALSAQADEQVRKLASTLTKFTNQKFTEPGKPVWLKRTSVKFGVAGKQPTWVIKTLQPVSEARNETVFMQGRLRKEDGSVVSNIGSGYRWFTDSARFALGLNGFYDQDSSSSTKRFSVGGEVFSKNASLRANLYNAVGGHAVTPGGLPARDGFDLHLEAPIPILRHTRLSLKTYQWNPSTSISSVQGWNAALKTNPHHKLSLELGASRSTRNEAALFMNLTYHYGSRNKRKPAIFDRLAPQQTQIVRDYTLQGGSS